MSFSPPSSSSPAPFQPTFQDTSTECAICLEPFEGQSDRPGRRVLTLTCGHKWHYDCLVQQLQVAQPTSAKRLLFTGCRCATCGSFCDHPELENLTRTTDRLRAKVDTMLEEQIQSDAPDVWKRAIASNDPSTSRQAVLDDARRKYAFYLCSHCKDPFFGGTMECADMVGGDADGDEAQERLCVACAPQSQIACQNPLDHRRYLVWKCRYCCQPSTHLCYGNVHFCDGCHRRNSERVRELQCRQRYPNREGRNDFQPPPLEPIPCPGGSCPFPKRGDLLHHPNGPTKDCELVYSCACCESDAGQGGIHTEIPPGSNNLLQNPSGQNGLQGWRQLNPTMSWRVETSDLPVDAGTTTNFVSSFQPCVMCQVLDLSRILRTIDEHDTVPSPPIRLEISARYMGRSDCPSVFRLESILLDGNVHQQDTTTGRQMPSSLQRLATPTLETPPDYWERASLEMELPPDALRGDRTGRNQRLLLQVVVIGKDSRFWRGNFGSKVADVSVRVLGSPDHLRTVLKPDVFRMVSSFQPPEHDGRPPEQGRRSDIPNNADSRHGGGWAE